MNTATIEKIGWVLESEAYREKDSRISVLTEEGYSSFFVRSAQNMNAKNRHLCMPLSKVSLMVRKQQVLTGRLLAQPVGYSDLVCLSMAGVLVDLLHETNQSERYYGRVSAWFEAKCDLTHFALILARHLEWTGIAPFVDGCVICGQTKVVDFSVNKGGFVCARHATDQLTPSQLKGFYRLFHLSEDQEARFLSTYQIDRAQLALLLQFWMRYGTKRAKSAEFLLTNL